LLFGATGRCGRAVVKRGLAARGESPRAASLGLFAEGGVAETCSTPGTTAFRLLALDENSGARRHEDFHHGLLANGYAVTAFVRNPAKAAGLFDATLDQERPRLRIVEGDIANRSQVLEAMAEQDTIVSCLASFEPPHTTISTLVGHVLHGAERFGEPNLRVLIYSLCGVAKDGDWISHTIQNTLRVVSPRKFGPAIRDHLEVIKLLEASSLDYTLFQTATMVDKPMGQAYRSGSAEHCPGARLWHRLGFEDAAEACIDALGEKNLPRLYMRYSG